MILTYNSLSTLGRVFDLAILSALRQDYPNFEVLVTDNGSRDGTIGYVKARFGDRVKVVELGKNYGFCLGNNLALKYVSPDAKYILFQNPDAILSRDYVRKLVEVLELDPSVIAAQGVEIQPSGLKRLGGLLGYAGHYRFSEVRQSSSPHSLREVLFVFGAAMLVRRRLFEVLGGFPSEYFMYFDEADFGLRARAYGFRMVGLASTWYFHLVSGTVSKDPFARVIVYYLRIRNRLLTVLKFFYGRYLLKAFVLNTAMIFLHLVKRDPQSRLSLVYAVRSCIKLLRYAVSMRKLYVPKLRRRRVLERWLHEA